MCRISVKLLQGLCALCVCAHHLTDPLEPPGMGELGRDQPLRFRTSAFVLCVFCIWLFTLLYLFFFFPPNGCSFTSNMIQCCVLFMATSEDINKMISNLPLNILEQPCCTLSRFADDTELVVQLAHLKDGMPSRGTSISSSGPMGTL